MYLDPTILFEKLAGLFAADFWSLLSGRASALLDAMRPYSTIASLLFLTGIVYCFLRIEQIEAATKHYDVARKGEGEHAEYKVEPDSANTVSARFDRMRKRLDSGRESEWRLAILDADALLDEMITGMGYRGDSLGEKLKGIEKSDFTTLDIAWEAHAVRNKIAHEGAAFALSEREARRVLSLYEEVFREFRYL